MESVFSTERIFGILTVFHYNMIDDNIES